MQERRRNTGEKEECRREGGMQERRRNAGEKERRRKGTRERSDAGKDDSGQKGWRSDKFSSLTILI